MSQLMFRDRMDAGKQLAAAIEREFPRVSGSGAIVLGLPRGGVPVAAETARAFHLRLDVFLVRKLGVPGEEELAMGAIASGGVIVRNQDVCIAAEVTEREWDKVVAEESAELQRRESLYRSGAAGLDVSGRFVILIDDGLATGASMRAAITVIRRTAAKELLVAVPVGAPTTCDVIARLADRFVCLEKPADFRSVGAYYESFPQVQDWEVSQVMRAFCRDHRVDSTHAR